MKSIIIKIKGTSYLEILSRYGFNVTSEAELAVLRTLHELYSNNTFMLNEVVKQQIKAKTGGSEGKVKTLVSRLIKSGALVKEGRLIGFNMAFKDIGTAEQLVIRINQ